MRRWSRCSSLDLDAKRRRVVISGGVEVANGSIWNIHARWKPSARFWKKYSITGFLSAGSSTSGCKKHPSRSAIALERGSSYGDLGQNRKWGFFDSNRTSWKTSNHVLCFVLY